MIPVREFDDDDHSYSLQQNTEFLNGHIITFANIRKGGLIAVGLT